eukprot:181217-Chlamydomonas_euryale.AAC.9
MAQAAGGCSADGYKCRDDYGFECVFDGECFAPPACDEKYSVGRDAPPPCSGGQHDLDTAGDCDGGKFASRRPKYRKP